MTLTTLNLTLTDPHDTFILLIQYLCRSFVYVALLICRSFEPLPMSQLIGYICGEWGSSSIGLQLVISRLDFTADSATTALQMN